LQKRHWKVVGSFSFYVGLERVEGLGGR
jgi:hypothetical protein